jgi:protein transport protein SEC24
VQQQWGEKDKVGSVVLPPALRLSTTQLESHGAYLLDDGRHIYIWCGPSVDPALLEDLTGSPAFHLIDPLKVTLEPREGELSRRVWEVIRTLRARTPQEQVVQLALPRSRSELQFFAALVEDKSPQGMSYVDFLCQLHKHIQTKISGYVPLPSTSSLCKSGPTHHQSPRGDCDLCSDESSQVAMRAMVEWS